MCWNDYNIELIDFVEFFCLGKSGTSHACQLVVEAKKVLEGDGRQGMVLALDLDPFFGLDGLVQTLAVAASWHLATRELVNNDDFAIFDDVVFVALEDDMRFNGILHVARQFHVFRLVDVFHTRQLLNFFDTGICEQHGASFLFNGIVGFFFQARRPARKFRVLVGRFLALARDDERGARFVDQDVINLVNDGVVQVALHKLVERVDHVFAQVVKAKFVVGAIGNISVVGGSPLGSERFDSVHNHTDGQPQKLVDLSHPFGITTRQVVVDGDDMHSPARQRVQVSGQGCNQRLTFTGTHLGYFALVQYDAADKLHVVMAHSDSTLPCFAHDSKSFRQDIFERAPGAITFHNIGQELINSLGF